MIKLKDNFKSIKYICLVIFCLCLITVIYNFKIKTRYSEEVVTDYLSVTTSSMEKENFFYTFEIDNSLIKEQLVIEDTAQYPLGVIDYKNQKIYYSQRVDGKDQIFLYDMKNKKAQQLTNDFHAINKIYPYQDKLYILAKTVNNPRVSLIEYDLNKEKYNILTKKSIQVVTMSHSEENACLFYASYNWDEQEKLHKEFQETPEKQPTPLNSRYTIYRLNYISGIIDKIFETELLVSNMSVFPNQEKFILRVSKSLFEPKTIILYDVINSEIKEINIKNIGAIENISFYKNGFFFTGIKESEIDLNELGNISPPNSILYMDLNSNEIKEIMSFEDKYINNFDLFTNNCQ